MLEQHETVPDDVGRRNIVGRFIGSLRSFDARWPQLGQTLSTLPQMTIGALGIRNVMPEPLGDLAAPVVGVAALAAMGAYLGGKWPFNHNDHALPERDASSYILELDNKHLDS